jgi:hypothetical protein
MPETQSWNNVLKKGHFANLLDKYVDVERQWRDDMKLHEGSEGSKFVVRWTLKDTGDAAVPGYCHSKLQ